MKAILALVSGLLVSASAFAVQDGIYHCATTDGKVSVVYKFETLTAGTLSVPVVEITRVFLNDDNTTTSTYVVKGIANIFSDNKGSEKLVIGNNTVELTAGRPSCVKQ